ncbi:MAG: 3-hydroxyacyl-CoA dehydrogenase family protein, partial [Candidatus Bathyarchaeota archaeon]|nr:3-hydroxyacyl-CoA dehydrogenase family protein [Candidatus Bathyarchaeota archaeon]
MEIKKVAVVGAGAMGHGIGQVAAMAGFEVTLRDVNDELLTGAMEKINWSLNKLVQKNRIAEEDAKKTVDRIKLVVPLEEAVKNVDYVIEAIPEKLNLKRQIFSEMDKFAPSHAILASNTSALLITEIAEATNRPDKVVGMHFFNPAQLMRLVEVVMGEKTSEETCNIAVELTKKLGKEPVVCRKDVPGFIANRITIPA